MQQIPESLRFYLESIERDDSVATAVASLLADFDGKSNLGMNWSERRQYNLALLSATQIRTDYIETLFQIGQSISESLLDRPPFYSDDFFIKEIWQDKQLGIRIRSTSENDLYLTLNSEGFYVEILTDKALLAKDVVDWEVEETGWCQRFFDLEKFLDDTQGVLRTTISDLKTIGW